MKDCLIQCETCSDDTTCLTCSSLNPHFYNQNCYANCPLGAYADSPFSCGSKNKRENKITFYKLVQLLVSLVLNLLQSVQAAMERFHFFMKKPVY